MQKLEQYLPYAAEFQTSPTSFQDYNPGKHESGRDNGAVVATRAGRNWRILLK